MNVPEVTIDWNTLDSNSSSNHDVLEITFDEPENELKFDKLVTMKKIKSPFKRHLSNEKIELSSDNATFGDFKSTYSENYGNENKKFKSVQPDRPVSQSSDEGMFETNPEILDRRQKQIDYGKNTQGYANYLKAIPKKNRSREHPQTPKKYYKHSRRSWDALIKLWRKKLHEFDQGADADKKS